MPGAVLVGVTDRDAARARAFAARARGVRVFPDLDVDGRRRRRAWSTSSPRPHAHAEVALEALERGCHVLVEKPLATSDADCARLAEAASRRGRRVGVNHSLLADPHVRHVLDTVATGRVGQPLSAEYFCSAAYPPWEDGPLPPHYRDGGNPFRDLGVHGLYLLRAVLGEIEGVEPVFAARGGDPNLCFDEWYVVVRCERGIGHVRLSWNVRPLQTVFTVHATRGHAACRRGLDVRDRPTRHRAAPRARPRRRRAPGGLARAAVGAGERVALAVGAPAAVRGAATRRGAVLRRAGRRHAAARVARGRPPRGALGRGGRPPRGRGQVAARAGDTVLAPAPTRW